MKKFLSVVVTAVLVLGVLSLVSCKKSSTTSPTPVATATPSTTTINFTAASDVSLVKINDDPTAAAFTAVSHDTTTTDADGGTGCASVTASFVYATAADKKGQISVVFGTTAEKDLTGKTISFKIYVPTAMAALNGNYGIQIQAFSDINGNPYTYADGGWNNFPTTAGWHTITWSPTTTAGAWDVSKITKIALQITETSAAGDLTPTILFDDITY
jgi:hypothetical protein